MDSFLTLILALLLDQWLGEPKKYHPLVGFGYLANAIETLLLKQNHSNNQQKAFGFMALIFLISVLSGMVYSLTQSSLINWFIAPILVYFCIAANSLKQHADQVKVALNEGDLNLAKHKVAMIVSRQTKHMTAEDVTKATIESVLENGADAVFAPIFWFIIAGPIGAVVYRLSNTLDAMWGYKNQQYFYFGWAVARFDDLLNWIPARLTALSYALLGETRQALDCWKNQAAALDSPNAGPVMTSGAGSLNLQLGGPAWYHGKLKDKVFFGSTNSPKTNDIDRANQLVKHCLYLWIIILFVLTSIGVNLA